MKILFIGGTGTISMAITKQILKEGKHELYLLNRGNRNIGLNGIKEIKADINGDINTLKEVLKDYSFDCVCDFMNYSRIKQNNLSLYLVHQLIKSLLKTL